MYIDTHTRTHTHIALYVDVRIGHERAHYDLLLYITSFETAVIFFVSVLQHYIEKIFGNKKKIYGKEGFTVDICAISKRDRMNEREIDMHEFVYVFVCAST